MGHFNFVPNTEIKILKNVYTVIECTNESLKLLHVFVKLSRLFNVIFDYLIVTHITCTCIHSADGGQLLHKWFYFKWKCCQKDQVL